MPAKKTRDKYASQAGISVIRASLVGQQHDACSPDPYIAAAIEEILSR